VEVTLPLAKVDPLSIYKVSGSITDTEGRVITCQRYVGGFVAVPKAKQAIRVDGNLDEADWQRAPVEKIDELRQFFAFGSGVAPWAGLNDLSGDVKFLWDDHYLYVGVKTKEAVFSGKQEDSMIWAQDGLQFLIDPCRAMEESVGKYDYAVAVGKKGPQAWCYLTADGGALNGEAKDILIGVKRATDGTGGMNYEVAFPWSRIAPFKPALDANLGLTIMLNRDGGRGRDSFLTWFGNANTKQVGSVGDLILTR
jgi:hypothetical protein